MAGGVGLTFLLPLLLLNLAELLLLKEVGWSDEAILVCKLLALHFPLALYHLVLCPEPVALANLCRLNQPGHVFGLRHSQAPVSPAHLEHNSM